MSFIRVRLNIADALIAYGREKGFTFDKNDMKVFAKEIMQSSDELSDEEPEVAAGGAAILSAIVVFGILSAVILGMGVAGVVASVAKE